MLNRRGFAWSTLSTIDVLEDSSFPFLILAFLAMPISWDRRRSIDGQASMQNTASLNGPVTEGLPFPLISTTFTPPC